MILIILVLSHISNALECVSDNGTCTVGIYGGYCQLDVHVDETTSMPLNKEQSCISYESEFEIVRCHTQKVYNYTDLKQLCCEVTDYCNKCPHKDLVDLIDTHYSNKLFDLFPDSCKSSSTIVTVLSTPSSIPYIMTDQTALYSPTVTIDSTSQPNDNNTNQYVYIFVVMATLGLFVVCAVISVFIIIVHLIIRSRRQKVREIPLEPNETFRDFNHGENSCSSNFYNGSKYLHPRTIVDDVKLGLQLGRGKFGNVYKGKWNGQTVAVKIYDSRHEIEWLREVNIYGTKMLNHINILKYSASDKKESGNGSAYTGDTIHLWTLLEFHPNGNLQEYLSCRPIVLKEAFILATSLLDGLHYLHTSFKTGSYQKPGIAHRDIKSPNILVKADFTCCIGDLGLAVKQKDDTGVDMIPSNRLSGTRRYLPPEILNESMNFEKFSSYVSNDIYSVSLVIWEIYQVSSAGCYKIPYYEYLSHSPSLEKIKEIVVTEGCRPSLKIFNEELSFLKNILIESWSDSPLARPSALNINKKLKIQQLTLK